MEDKLNRKLSEIIKKRKTNLVNIQEFDERFFLFAKKTIKEVTQTINDELKNSTQDFLKIYYDNPFSMLTTQYYVQVQFSSGFSRNRFDLMSTESNPVITFEGYEMNGQVKVFIKSSSDKNLKSIGTYGISQLNEEKTAEILIDFLDKVFSF